MNYKNVIEYLYNSLPMFQRQGKAAYKANLNNSFALDKYFNYSHKKFDTIHIAGTNGKGSVSHMIASVLQASGYKVGLYTSPHLKDFRERIKVNGKMISKNEITDIVNKNINIFTKIKPSFFEITVAMAFHYFEKQNVDIAIIEVGLGGRLDSTNIISPILSIITNIGLDHTEFLGNTLEKIAFEKAGIIKQDRPVIIGEIHKSTKQVFIDIAKQKTAKIYFANDYFNIDYSMYTIDNKQSMNVYKNGILYYDNMLCGLLGIYQQKNLISALLAFDILNKQKYKISEKNIREGISKVVINTGLYGRWQIVGNNPRVICDTGHNENGILSVLKQIKQTPYKKLHFVLGLVNDKNYNGILSLLPKHATYYFTKASIPRALDENILSKYANNFELKGMAYVNVKSAYNAALQNACNNDLVFIGGSTFIVADLLQIVDN